MKESNLGEALPERTSPAWTTFFFIKKETEIKRKHYIAQKLNPKCSGISITFDNYL